MDKDRDYDNPKLWIFTRIGIWSSPCGAHGVLICSEIENAEPYTDPITESENGNGT